MLGENNMAIRGSILLRIISMQRAKLRSHWKILWNSWFARITANVHVWSPSGATCGEYITDNGHELPEAIFIIVVL